MEAIIKEITRIYHFSTKDLELLTDALVVKKIDKGEYFLKEGEVSNKIGFVKQGLFLYFKLTDGEEIPCDFAIENQWLIHLKSFSSNTASEMNIKALENAEVLILTKSKLQILTDAQPKFLMLQNYYTEQSFINNNEHTYRLSALNAKERYYHFMEHFPELLQRVPQYYIAAYLGIKPQSLSRIRK